MVSTEVQRGGIRMKLYRHDTEPALKDKVFLGYPDQVPGEDYFRELVEAASQWARSQGALQLWGPIEGSTYNSYRLRLDHFENEPFWGEPSNKSEAVRYFEKCGFQLGARYLTYAFNRTPEIDSQISQISSAIPGHLTQDLCIEPLTAESFEENKEGLYRAAHEIFQENFLYTHLDAGEFKSLYRPLMAAPFFSKTSAFLREQSGRIVGLMINFEKDGILYIKTLGIQKDFRRMGSSFLWLAADAIRKTKTCKIYFCLMRDGNVPSLIGNRWPHETRQYGLFVKEL